MKRRLDINDHDQFNRWVWRSICLFRETSYLDDIQGVYPFGIAVPERMRDAERREVIHAHHARLVEELLELLKKRVKFPYDDPVWYLIKNVRGCSDNNPAQLNRIASSLFAMTSDEVVTRLESPPKINTQIGPMFGAWVRKRFTSLRAEEFIDAEEGIYVLEASEEEGKRFVETHLGQDLAKRPDLIAKVNTQYVIGEAKWIGQPGGNQGKQVEEVIQFCGSQRGNVRRIGIVDGFPWVLYNANGTLIESKEAVVIQESPYDMLSALLLEEYLRAH
jgi:hypothetical protein